MHLLRWRPRSYDLVLPNGARVKIEENDRRTTQHVHDPHDRVHGTARPPAIDVFARGLGFAEQFLRRRRQARALRADRRYTDGPRAFAHDDERGLWAPLPPEIVRAR